MGIYIKDNTNNCISRLLKAPRGHLLILISFIYEHNYYIRKIVNAVIETKKKICPTKPWFLRVSCKKVFENTVGKGEIARNEQFVLFPQCFLPIGRYFCHFHEI